jgi:hypothetical protein
MVSKTLASLDAWLAEAEAVLAEQRNHPVSENSARRDRTDEAVQLSLFEEEL